MGKFYELYHQDAVIGFEQLNLKPMASGGGKQVAHCGFPEGAFSRYSEQLVERGHKVARVEQTETPQMMEERNLKGMNRCLTSWSHCSVMFVVRREVCRITTAGTKTFSFLDGDSGSSQSAYLLAICEQGDSRGICFVDTATGQMQIGQFEDDEQNSRLRTLLAHYPPAEVLCEKGRISSATKNLLSSLFRPSQWQQLQPNSQFWSDKSTLMHLGGSEYFLPEKEEEAESKGLRGKDLYPPVLKSMLDDGDVLSLTAKSEFRLAVRSLGAVIWYLKECLIDHDVLSLKKMSMYSPLGTEPTTVDPVSKQEFAKHMVCTQLLMHIKLFSLFRSILTCILTYFDFQIIDAVSIRNLDILRSSAGGPYTTEGTLYRCLDFCNTPFGTFQFKMFYHLVELRMTTVRYSGFHFRETTTSPVGLRTPLRSRSDQCSTGRRGQFVGDDRVREKVVRDFEEDPRRGTFVAEVRTYTVYVHSLIVHIVQSIAVQDSHLGIAQQKQKSSRQSSCFLRCRQVQQTKDHRLPECH